MKGRQNVGTAYQADGRWDSLTYYIMDLHGVKYSYPAENYWSV